MKRNIFIALLICTTGLRAQFKQPFFNTISVENGLPEGFIQASLQDRLGYLWFGTQNGLVRYDGYNTKIYDMPDDDGKPVYFASVQKLFEDKQGNLWVNIFNKGNYKFDRQKNVFIKANTSNAAFNKVLANSFQKIIYDKKNDLGCGLEFDTKLNCWTVWMLDLAHGTANLFSPASKANQLIASAMYADILIDSSGNTWLTTDKLLSMYDTVSRSFKPYFTLPASMNKFMFNFIIQDPLQKDLFWITTDLTDSTQDANKAKIIQLNIRTKNYKIYDHIASDPNSIAGTCAEIYIDPLKRIFFYTDHGISMYNRSTEKFTNYILSVPGRTAKDIIGIRYVAADKEGNLWISGRFNGLFFLNTTTAATSFYTHTDNAGSLPDSKNGINNMFVDRSGIVWISIPPVGVSSLDPKRSFFNAVKINAPAKEMDKNPGAIATTIRGMYNDSTFFITDGKGIFIWDYTNDTFKDITPGNRMPESFKKSVITDREGLIWMATATGLYSYSPITKATKNYRNDPKDSFSIGTNYISLLSEDNDGTLWIGTINNGLNSFNKKTGKFTRYPFIDNNLSIKANNVLDDRTVNSLLCGKDGMVWIGTNLGSLNRFDPKKGKFTSYMDTKEASVSIISLYEDSRSRLWAGSYLSGVFLVDKDSGFSKHFTERDGLSSNDIKGITEDKKGNIWLATSHGLSKIDPVTNQITNYTTVNGLPVVQTLGIYRDSKGIFYVSIKGGVIPFDPDNITVNKIAPEVVIESVKYHDAAINKDSMLFTEGLQHIALKYNENKVSFQYVALHFSNALLNQYAYQLEGYDKYWIKAGTERTATYTNLSTGTYTFKVKAANSDGIWNETGADFTFTILPPWWKTWWAYTIYALVFLGALRIFSKWRERKLRNEKDVLELKVNERTQQLQESLVSLKATQSQLIQSEKMASLGELTAGIAHEIQNPLNFVNNFSEVSNELIDEMKMELDKGDVTEAKMIADDIKTNLEKINHHGKRADAIVKGMLQHSRTSSGAKEPTDINALCDEYLRLAYHGLRAKDKSFTAKFETRFDATIPKINVVPQDMGRVILNLINNAFYAVTEKRKQHLENYEPTVTVSTKKENDTIIISIEDNGTGIPQQLVDKIFQPFFTTKPTGSGTGLGLSLSYDIVKAHGGILKVESKEGEGTTFIIQLPIN